MKLFFFLPAAGKLNLPSPLKRSAFFLLFSFAAGAYAQPFQPGIPGAFGVDADLRTDSRQQGTFAPAGSHDWLPFTGVSSSAVFDTSGAGLVLSQVLQGKNFSFTKKMAAQPYTLQGGKLMLDGIYARDYFGWDKTGQRRDQTAFVSSQQVASKNAGNPALWSVEQNGTAVPSKSDIVDSYIHMRRNGNSIAVGNPSNLIVYMGAAVLAVEGDHHIDFELFRSGLAYDATTNLFTNGGPEATGGRYPWEFNADGSIRSYGNLALSFSFNSSAVTDIAIYLWVEYNTLRTVNPAAFDFVASDWNGLNPNGGYGFVKVQLKGFSPLPAFAAVNTGAVNAPQWGTNSKDHGLVNNSYAATTYAPGQFVEAAIDLTALGIDPALSTVFDRCSPPFRRVLVKSRSSSAFSSALQDFVGPHPFLDAPTIPAQIAEAAPITCTVTGVTLRPVHEVAGASYTWSTTDGSILTDPDQMTVQVNAKGTYTLTTSIMQGCTPQSEEVKVYEKKNKPAAKMKVDGTLTDIDGDQVLEFVTLTPEVTTSGHDAGLGYQWTGPNGFERTAPTVTTNKEGSYNVTITDIATGCSCEVPVQLKAITYNVLPVRFVAEKAAAAAAGVQLDWKIEVSPALRYFSIEQSGNGQKFTEIGTLSAVKQPGTTSFSFLDKSPRSGRSYYRIKAVEEDGEATYSRVMVVEGNFTASSPKAFADAAQGVTIDYRAARAEVVSLELYSASGQLLAAQMQQVQAGTNRLRLSSVPPMKNGIYLVVVQSASDRQTAKFMKQ